MVLFTIARNAFLESIRQPIHAVLVCVGLLALLLNVNIAAYTLEDDNKLLIDLGLSTLFLAGLLLAAFTATSVLSREIENKTVLTVVSKPVPRAVVVVGKFLGVTAAIATAYWLLAVAFLLTVRHRVQTTVRVEDTYDSVVITFSLLALMATLVVSGLANYLYRRPFPSTFAIVGAVAATVAWSIVSCVDRSWSLQSPAKDFDPQLAIGLVMVLEAILVLTAVAIAASTRLGQISTLLVCITTFVVGLIGEYFLSLAAGGGGWAAALAAVVPNMQFFWPADALTQGHPISLGYLGALSLYAACMIGGILALAVVLFQNRDVG
ncbi:MAG: ABC transporter permease subunit [Pirellulales bacterium]